MAEFPTTIVSDQYGDYSEVCVNQDNIHVIAVEGDTAADLSFSVEQARRLRRVLTAAIRHVEYQ